MTRRLTPAERLAAADKDIPLYRIVQSSSWDQFLVEQAVFAVGRARSDFSCNTLRELLPEQGHGFLGAAINALRSAGIIEHANGMVPSTSARTHGHRISLWRLSEKGLAIAKARSASSQGRAA
ncbi:hypothetical protein [Streptomyces albireticuli]|uniref:MarR family transcriptional regulator n=1 Tax=Streptomyces albireticuli TaxID=1940 RepID=A0A2A2D4M8_9ACTN|nr:hypothetical protein [Streptomyces albireticuli]MCD9194246.1 hypothetical protein [Streptomyces albireticuli]PAU47393.1 hypothetical protein CK936_19110 [Streptomyces albireticuli]